jgi:hypothetical protein
MVRILLFVVVVVVITSLLGKLCKTWAGTSAGVLLLLTLAVYRLGDHAPDLLKLAWGALLIWTGWYASARESGIARVWSYLAVGVGGLLALGGLAGVVLDLILGLEA